MSRTLRVRQVAVSATAGIMATLILMPVTVSAGEEPKAAEISAAVSDHSYQGSMSKAGSVFSEYYAPDGTIRADGYAGKWRTIDGAMCFQYGDSAERCFAVSIDGPSMVMYKEGKIDGNGMLIPGNPNGFD